MALVAQYTTPTIVTDSLDQALRLAQPGGYIRTFVDEGNAVEVLLRVRAVTSNSITSYINTILAAYNVSNNSASAITPTNETPFVNQTKPGQEFESLTERELEVLSLVASGASNREIGEKMVITLPTVKKHLSNIFSKLNVTSRTQLLVRAKELSLLLTHCYLQLKYNSRFIFPAKKYDSGMPTIFSWFVKVILWISVRGGDKVGDS